MFNITDVKDVHLELSTLCNASCPLCPRNFHGYPHNNGYPETHFSLAMAQKIFEPKFLSQLESIRINGNYGDMVMNPETLEVVNYFRSSNHNLKIQISTNGGARTREFWQGLAKAGTHVSFCLDGLEDTHHLYRQNTVWSTVIKNAKTFIDSGGYAIWKFIKFDHNMHQVEDCKKLSQELGFKEFSIVNHGRNIGPVFDKDGVHTHNIGKYKGETEFKVLFQKKITDEVILEDVAALRTPKKTIRCKSKINRSIYVAANGDVSPCCFTGFYPKTYGKGGYHQAVNSQINSLATKNNALKHSLEECIQWFDSVEGCWSKSTYESGRLIVCDDYCGI